MSDIKPGDVVTLKSGSQPMTVLWTNQDGNAGLAWEDTNGDHKTASYRTIALKKE